MSPPADGRPLYDSIAEEYERHARTSAYNALDWLGEATFDAAVLALVLHYVDDRVAALRELHRVLRPGGHLVVSTHHPTGDWVRLGGSYFSTEVVEELWQEGRWPMRYWRQPLTATCAEFAAAGFLVERLVEPLPRAEMADRYPADYEKLTREPGFVVFRLLKPAAAVG